MPTYDYKCQNCDYEFEAFQSITAKHLRKCPQCGRLKLIRLIGTGAGVIFKGSGFYETDYRSDGYKQAAKKDTEPKAGSDKKQSKSDSTDKTKSKSKPADTKIKKEK